MDIAMDDSWKFFSEMSTAFADEAYNQFHVDTRDFHVNYFNGELPPTLNLRPLAKYPEKFLHTPEEVMQTLTRLFNESGGKAEWRMLSLKGMEGEKVSYNWGMKYIRIYRVKSVRLVICNNKHYMLNKDTLKSPVDQEYLHAH